MDSGGKELERKTCFGNDPSEAWRTSERMQSHVRLSSWSEELCLGSPKKAVWFGVCVLVSIQCYVYLRVCVCVWSLGR